MASDCATLILPVENQVRELDAKLLMACVAAERGFPVVLGSRTYIHFAMPFLQRGLFLAKSLRPISALMLNFIRDLGHDIVAWDEESLVRFSSPEYCAWRYSEETFGIPSRLFAWGPDDAELFAHYPGYTGAPIDVTGNPRMDLLRPELRSCFDAEAALLRERYGAFILVNTNFPFVNPYVPGLALLQPGTQGQGLQVGRTGRGLSLDCARGMHAHIQAIHKHFRQLIPRLSAWFPEHTIIVRPHPSEDHDRWREVVRGQARVHVIHQGNVAPWLMASEVLLHNGCTTAVEAAVLGKPAITYQPVTSACFDYPLPNALSHRAYSSEQVRDQLAEVLAGRRGLIDAAQREAVLARHLVSTDGPLAVDRIMDVLVAAGYGRRRPQSTGAGRLARGWLGTNVRTAVKLLNRLRPRHRNSAAYHAHRFPEIGIEDIERRIARFGRLLGRFDGIRVRRASKYIFHLSPPDAQRDAPKR